MAAAWGAAAEVPQNGMKPGVVVVTQSAAVMSGFWSVPPPARAEEDVAGRDRAPVRVEEDPPGAVRAVGLDRVRRPAGEGAAARGADVGRGHGDGAVAAVVAEDRPRGGEGQPSPVGVAPEGLGRARPAHDHDPLAGEPEAHDLERVHGRDGLVVDRAVQDGREGGVEEEEVVVGGGPPERVRPLQGDGGGRVGRERVGVRRASAREAVEAVDRQALPRPTPVIAGDRRAAVDEVAFPRAGRAGVQPAGVAGRAEEEGAARPSPCSRPARSPRPGTPPRRST